MVNRHKIRCYLWLVSLHYAMYTKVTQEEKRSSILQLCFYCQIYRDWCRDNNENVICACFNIAPGLWKLRLVCAPVSLLCYVYACPVNSPPPSILPAFKKIKTCWCVSQKTMQGQQLRFLTAGISARNLCPRGFVSSSNNMLELRLPNHLIDVPFQNSWVYRKYDLSSDILISKLSHIFHGVVISFHSLSFLKPEKEGVCLPLVFILLDCIKCFKPKVRQQLPIMYWLHLFLS